MRRGDQRGRRSRRTLAVDLGEDVSRNLEDLLDTLNSPTWASIRRFYPNPLVRGQVVRLAVMTLYHYVNGEQLPLHRAAGVPRSED